MITHGRVEDIVTSIQQTKVIEVRLISGAAEASMFLHGKPNIGNTTLTGTSSFKFEFTGDVGDQFEILKTLMSDGYQVIGFTEESANLEDVFLRMTTGAVN